MREARGRPEIGEFQRATRDMFWLQADMAG
jgi:hypothetical protein